MFKKLFVSLLITFFLFSFVPLPFSHADAPVPPTPIDSGSRTTPHELTGDRPPTTSFRWVGHGGVVVGAVPYTYANNPAGAISISGIPSGAAIVKALFYATGWESNGAATGTFEGHSLNSVAPIYTDPGGGLNLGMYIWNVTDYVNGNGSFVYSTSNINHSYASMLVVVYQQSAQPIRQVVINEGMESMANTSSTSVWQNVTPGNGRLIVMTEADDTVSGGNESISFNGTLLESGDVFHANLGLYASLLTYNINATNGQNNTTLTTTTDWFGWHLAILEVESGALPRVDLNGLEVNQAVQDLKNTNVLVENRKTFVRAHVSTDQTFYNASARLVGMRGGVALPGSPLTPANQGGSINIIDNPNRAVINDSFLFELPSSWLNGTIDLQVQPVGYDLTCKEIASIANDCKATVSFTQTPPVDLRIVGGIWKQSNGTRHAPSDADILELVKEIEATYPIPRLQWDNPYDFELIFENWVQDPITLNIRLAEQRVLDGCVNALGLGCQRLYLGVIVDPPTGTSLLGLGGVPANVASGFWINSSTYRGILPHELAHALGRLHTPFCNAKTLPWWHYPYSDGHISQADSGNDAFYGFHIYNKTVFSPTTGDLMSYCFPVWPSDWTYKALRTEIQSRYNVSSQFVGLDPNAPAMLVSGRVASGGSTGSIESVYSFAALEDITVPVTGAYQLRLEDLAGNLLLIYPFDPGSGEQCPPYCSTDEQFDAFAIAVPAIPNVARIMLMKDQAVLDSRVASNNAPTVTVNYPNGGEILSTGIATITWTASDLDQNTLTYALQFSRNAGSTWETIATGLHATSYEVDLLKIAGTEQGLIRVLASDGFHTSIDQSDDLFTIIGHAPQISIDAPVNNAYYSNDQAVIFEASGWDREDGQLPDAAFTWSSSLNGVLGTGHILSTSALALSEGEHTITLTAIDLNGQSTSSSIIIKIYRAQPILPPVLSAAPAHLNLSGFSAGPTSQQILSIRNDGNGSIQWTASADVNWISFDTITGTGPMDILVSANPAGLTSGVYTGAITISDPQASNSPQIIQVTFQIIDHSKIFLPILRK